MFTILALLIGLSTSAQASLFYMARVDGSIGGVGAHSDDVVVYDTATAGASVVLSGHTTFDTIYEDIDALHVLNDGTILFSTMGSAAIGSLSISDEDIVLYNPATGDASMFLDAGGLFVGNENIDALTMLPNGNLLISTRNSAQIGSLLFEDGDIVEYDLTTGAASIWLGTAATGGIDINKLHLMPDGSLLFGLFNTKPDNEFTVNGVSFTACDLLAFDPATGSVSMYWDASEELGANSDITQIHGISVAPVPVPAAVWLLGSGLLGLAGIRRRL